MLTSEQIFVDTQGSLAVKACRQFLDAELESWCQKSMEGKLA